MVLTSHEIHLRRTSVTRFDDDGGRNQRHRPNGDEDAARRLGGKRLSDDDIPQTAQQKNTSAQDEIQHGDSCVDLALTPTALSP